MRMNRTVSLVAVVLLVSIVAAAPAANAQMQPPPDLTGTWNMDLEAFIGDANEPCVFEGVADIVDDGGSLTGRVDVVLVSGPDNCPPEMMADLTGGTQTGEAVGSVLVSGLLQGGEMFGEASFNGSISTNPGGSGTLSVSSGPFAGGSGNWMVQLQQSVLEIPTVSAVGLLLLTVLILAAGTLVLRHVASA